MVFLELNSIGELKPFIASLIEKKKLGKNEIFRNKLVSFDRKTTTFRYSNFSTIIFFN